jgi:RNA polymerase sigma-70 factor (ECF subfamily)
MYDKTSLENEQALLQLIAGGDENAFATLFHHYQQHLLRVVYQYVKSQALSEEIVQDVFLKIWTGREKLPEVQQFRSWLFILTRNYILNYLKKMAHEQAVRHAWMAEVPYTGIEADTGVRKHQMAELLHEAVNRLPEQQQKVFRLAREANLTYDQIAERLQLSPHTVRTHMSKALENIRRFLTARGASLILLLALHLAI